MRPRWHPLDENDDIDAELSVVLWCRAGGTVRAGVGEMRWEVRAREVASTKRKVWKAEKER